MTVGVHRQWEPIGGGERPEEEQVAGGILLRAKHTAEDPACGIVESSVQDEAGSASLEPGVVTAVHLDEHAGLRHAFAAAAMPWRAAGARAAEPGGREDATERGARDVDVFPFGEEIREVLKVHASIAGLGKAHEAAAQRLREAAWRGATAIPMDQGRGALDSIPGVEAAEVPDREAEKLGSVRHADLAAIQGTENEQATLGTLGQRNHLPHAP
jgi:hypothetical protein